MKKMPPRWSLGGSRVALPIPGAFGAVSATHVIQVPNIAIGCAELGLGFAEAFRDGFAVLFFERDQFINDRVQSALAGPKLGGRTGAWTKGQ